MITTLDDLGNDPRNFPVSFVWVTGIDNLRGEPVTDRCCVMSKPVKVPGEVEELPRSFALGGIAPLADHQADLIGFGDLVVIAGLGDCLSKPLQSLRHWIGEGGRDDIFRWVWKQIVVDEDQWVNFHPMEFHPE